MAVDIAELIKDTLISWTEYGTSVYLSNNAVEEVNGNIVKPLTFVQGVVKKEGAFPEYSFFRPDSLTAAEVFLTGIWNYYTNKRTLVLRTMPTVHLHFDINTKKFTYGWRCRLCYTDISIEEFIK